VAVESRGKEVGGHVPSHWEYRGEFRFSSVTGLLSCDRYDVSCFLSVSLWSELYM
jgi:hypothetical protein